MNRIFNKLLFIAFIFYTCHIIFTNGVALRKTRNSFEHGRTDGKDQMPMNQIFSFQGKSAHQSCVSVLKKCKRQSTCRETLKDLKTKCAIKSNSCNADMHDLQDCATIMDKMINFIDLSSRCICHHQNEGRCSKIYETIYENPCFASVRILRQKNLMPRTERKPETQVMADEGFKQISSKDVVEELLKSMEADHDDVALDNSKVTSLEDKQVNNQGFKHSDVNSAVEPEIESTEATQTKESEYEPKPNVANIAEAKPSQQDKKHSSSNSLLLYIIIGAVGLLVIVLVAVGFSLLLYFGVWKKGRNTTKASK